MTPADLARLNEQRQGDAAYTECAAAEIALRLRMARMQGTPADYRAMARLERLRPNPDLADARSCTQPGREHFDNDDDYTHARNER
jgi:hypothetical protein